jgi:hypothetical protein
MKQPSQEEQERKPGRSFEDPSRPLGEELLEHSRRSVAPTEENFRSRVVQARKQAAADRYGVAERAKVISVLRKAEELMADPKRPPRSEAELQRVLELAAHDVGLTLAEYRALMTGDEELIELETKVLADARRRCLQRE